MSSPSPTSELAVEEYRALRATIRERGTIRMIVSVLTFLAWPVLLALVAMPLVSPAFVLAPLVALWAGFEVVLAIHIGVERIGRYLQVRYESAGAPVPGWETVAMQLGREPAAATGSDPLLARLFVLAALLNLLPIGLEDAPRSGLSTQLQLVVAGVLHAAFVLRIVQARRFTGQQRARDLALFERLGG